jgi:DMSO/TMAO reductase YedYZ molybdopterin-dependent catalytic subunit
MAPKPLALTRVFRRAGRRTNVALLMVLLGAFASGWLAFAAGTPVPATLATVAHGLFGLGVVALMPWKSVIAGRASRIPWPAWALTALLLACLVAGFVQFFAGFTAFARLGALGQLSPIQLHVGAALVAVPLFGWHVLRRRPQRLRRSDLSRRNLLRAAAVTVGVVAGYPLGAALARVTRGTAGRVSTGSGRLAADDIPATIWLLDRVPAIDPAAHRVDVAGRPVSLAELDRSATPVLARLDCTSGWYAVATWTGTRVSDLLSPEQLAGAVSIEVTSVTGYTRRFPAAEASTLWLATRCEGRPLSPGTGAPVRLVAPHRRGFWWVKWVRSVRLSAEPAWLQPPFPLQ